MATLDQRLEAFATRVGAECKELRTLLNGNDEDLSALATTARTNLVASINELKEELRSIEASAGAIVNDQAVVSTTQVWSINRVSYELSQTAQAIKAEILGGASSAFDTLAELKLLLDSEASTLVSVVNMLSSRVRFDIPNQDLTATQKSYARTNIGAYGYPELGDTSLDLTHLFVERLT